jgi:hypothetical protein
MFVFKEKGDARGTKFLYQEFIWYCSIVICYSKVIFI